MIKQSIEMNCDLCRHPGKRFDSESQALKAGWLKIGQESYYEERSFFDSHICPDCKSKITEQLKSK